jgi:hypothetical protein
MQHPLYRGGGGGGFGRRSSASCLSRFSTCFLEPCLEAGTDVIIFAEKMAEIWRFLTPNKLCKILIITLVFEKNGNFFRRKLAKIAENCDHNVDLCSQLCASAKSSVTKNVWTFSTVKLSRIFYLPNIWNICLTI